MEPNYIHVWPRETFMLIALPNKVCFIFRNCLGYIIFWLKIIILPANEKKGGVGYISPGNDGSMTVKSYVQFVQHLY